MSAATIEPYWLWPGPATKYVGSARPVRPLAALLDLHPSAEDEVEAEWGFFQGDTVADCGPTLKGEFVRTLNLTCAYKEIGISTQHLRRESQRRSASMRAEEAPNLDGCVLLVPRLSGQE